MIWCILLLHACVPRECGECVVQRAALPCLIAGWRFWPLAHLITYTVIPLHLRVLWVDVLEVAWVAILSSCVAGTKPDVISDDAQSEKGKDEKKMDEDAGRGRIK